MYPNFSIFAFWLFNFCGERTPETVKFILLQFFTLVIAACTERTAKDQYVQGTKGQACVYTQLLQGYQ